MAVQGWGTRRGSDLHAHDAPLQLVHVSQLGVVIGDLFVSPLWLRVKAKMKGCSEASCVSAFVPRSGVRFVCASHAIVEELL